MGTHPIFESDFDCLTDKKNNKNGWWSSNVRCKSNQREKSSQARKRSYKPQRNQRRKTPSWSSSPRALYFRRLRLCNFRNHHEDPSFCWTGLTSIPLISVPPTYTKTLPDSLIFFSHLVY